MSVKKQKPQLMISAYQKAILKKVSKIIFDNIFYKYKLKKMTSKELIIKESNHYDIKNFNKEYNYQKKKYNKYTKYFSKKLNAINKTNLDRTYWESIIEQVLQMHINHTRYVFNYLENTKIDKYKFNLLHRKSFFIPNDANEYRNYFQYSYLGYEQLLSQYFINKNKYKSQNKYINNKNFKLAISVNKEPRLTSLKTFNIYELVLTIILKTTNLIAKKILRPKVLLLNVLFSKEKLLAIILKSFGKIQHTAMFNLHTKNVKKNLVKRNSIFDDGPIDDEYDRFFFSTMNISMPASWYEGYNAKVRSINAILDNYKKTKIIVSESTNENDVLLIAEAKKRGIKFYYNEHNFLQQFFAGNQLNNYTKKSDIFLSLGWQDKKYKNVIPIGSLYKWTVKNKSSQIKILFISSVCMAKKTFFAGDMGEMGSKAIRSYIKMNRTFFANLDESLINKICFRAHPHSININYEEHSMSDKDFLSDFIEKFDSYNTNLNIKSAELIAKADLVIVNYLSTPWLQSLVSNKPTIILFNKETYKFDKNYINFFKPLINENIVFEDAERAALFVKKINEDPGKWWNKNKLQKVRKNFLKMNFFENEKLSNFLIKLAE